MKVVAQMTRRLLTLGVAVVVFMAAHPAWASQPQRFKSEFFYDVTLPAGAFCEDFPVRFQGKLEFNDLLFLEEWPPSPEDEWTFISHMSGQEIRTNLVTGYSQTDLHRFTGFFSYQGFDLIHFEQSGLVSNVPGVMREAGRAWHMGPDAVPIHPITFRGTWLQYPEPSAFIDAACEDLAQS